MHPRKFALYGGTLMLLMGLAALIPSLSSSGQGELPALRVGTSYGLFLGFFPMNIFNKLALIIFGAAGIWASQSRFRSLPASILYCRWVFAVMGVFAILGLIPQTETLFDYWPLFGNEVLAHGVFAVVAGYFGFALSSRVPDVNRFHDTGVSHTQSVR